MVRWLMSDGIKNSGRRLYWFNSGLVVIEKGLKEMEKLPELVDSKQIHGKCKSRVLSLYHSF
jgi:hypothetical protein